MWKRLIAGLGGAVALTVLHEYVKQHMNEPPDFSEIGEQVIDKSLEVVNLQVKDPDKLYNATLAGDIITNGIYYALTPFKMNTLVGALGGLGAMLIPKQLGLDNDPVAGTDKKKIFTVGYYIFGALVSTGIYKLLTLNERKRD